MIDLNAVDRDMVRNCYTPRQVFVKAEAIARTRTARDVIAYLVQTAVNLSAMACKLSEVYTEDIFQPAATDEAGLFPYRHQVLAAASTCAHNAALFMQEAQRRPVRRADGYDPLIVSQPA
ncbi:hypothetical protein Acy02nite_22150 [Actinoplanes cyaneus]|uniref:Uncharacterized protein n=1 Tax=Actinoplanes cyaneus TaxID=52696 RepID=A0A919IEV0_9ACTN|nr:hypothetical protein [Actinoplanes cyaneus]MCW2136520.1 hypothetical protein [Actinoplanes cyaneus]GID64334.1 hypothetical protein Acy02nite_22150 [Actinoplanes cyaneus]